MCHVRRTAQSSWRLSTINCICYTFGVQEALTIIMVRLKSEKVSMLFVEGIFEQVLGSISRDQPAFGIS